MSGRTARVLSGPVLAAGLMALAAEQPDVAGLVAPASRYVGHYERELGSVIAEERYHQEAIWHRSREERTNRRLDSEFLMLRVPGEEDWLAIRDVIQVDGKRAEERSARFDAVPGDASRPLADRLRARGRGQCQAQRRRD